MASEKISPGVIKDLSFTFIAFVTSSNTTSMRICEYHDLSLVLLETALGPSRRLVPLDTGVYP